MKSGFELKKTRRLQPGTEQPHPIQVQPNPILAPFLEKLRNKGLSPNNVRLMLHQGLQQETA